jgi:hypothetical protein
MGALSMPAMLFIAFVVLQRLSELVLARRNTAALLALRISVEQRGLSRIKARSESVR